MKGNIDKLIDAASTAAYKIRKASPKQPLLAILVNFGFGIIYFGLSVSKNQEGQDHHFQSA
jgi:hypothetical protein